MEGTSGRKWNAICSEVSQIYCCLYEAINYIFDEVFDKEFRLNSTDVEEDDVYLLMDKAHFNNIKCENITYSESGSNEHAVILKDCAVLIDGILNLLDYYSHSLEIGKFLGELHYKSLTFFVYGNGGDLHVKINKGKTFFVYNNQATVLSLNLTDYAKHLNLIGDKFGERLVNLLKDEITDNNVESSLNKTIDLFSKNVSIFIEPEDNVPLNYIGYNEMIFDYFIPIKDVIFIKRFNVSFEFSLKYNILYKEGNFSVDNLIFYLKENVNVFMNNLTGKSANMSEILPAGNETEIWDKIFGDFNRLFNDYKDQIIKFRGNNKVV